MASVVLLVAWVIIWIFLGVYVLLLVHRHGAKTQKRIYDLLKIYRDLKEPELGEEINRLDREAKKDRYSFLKKQESFVFEIFDIGEYRYRTAIVLANKKTFTWVTRFKSLSKLLSFALKKLPMRYEEVTWTDLDSDRKMSYIKGTGNFTRGDTNDR